MDDVLRISPKIFAVPVIHGSGEFALTVRKLMLERSFDCVAVPLPPSFQQNVERAVELLPRPSLVGQAELPDFTDQNWSPETEDLDADGSGFQSSEDEPRTYSYVPVDPCQPVIAALRAALAERIPRAFIDLETNQFQPYGAMLPDPFALKKVSLDRFAAAILPTIPPPDSGQPVDRIRHMAQRLRELETRFGSILLVCSVLDWPWIRDAYTFPVEATAEDEEVSPTEIFRPDPKTLLFMLGELPFITGLYEQARAELEEDNNLSIDGVKQLYLSAREHYLADLKKRARKITPHLLRQCLKYARNLSLIESRFTPDLYTLVTAAKQTAGDQFALHVAETAREYPYAGDIPYSIMHLGIDQGRLADGEVVDLVSRLPGPPMVWRTLEIQKRPDRSDQRDWQMRWNPYSQCSWPPEDELIENFRSHVFDRAKAVLGADLARTEKFTTSVMDGIDIRETLRHWYDGEIYVKVLPPSTGRLDCVVMLFDSPADPRDYPWRTTWFAEHEEESTLAFFATDFHQEMVGPGIGLATYGGALFLFPPVMIPDIWHDPELDFCETLEERLLAAGCKYSTCPHVAIVSQLPPGAGWRRLAKKYGKKLVHLPLGQFSEAMVQQLRMMHVLNGKQVRSYAADFIRKA